MGPDPARPDSQSHPYPPEPPADLPVRTPAITPISPGTLLWRIHRRRHAALHFGRSGDNRFDAPDAAYGVCYAALSLEGAFAETCLRAVGGTLVTVAFLAERRATAIEATGPLRLATLHGAGLARLGATSAVASGPHPPARRWSAALHAHPAALDGIAYRPRHDDDAIVVALFERCQGRLRPMQADDPLADPVALAGLLDRYAMGLG